MKNGKLFNRERVKLHVGHIEDIVTHIGNKHGVDASFHTVTDGNKVYIEIEVKLPK